VPSKHDFRPAMKINLAAWRKPDPRSMPPQAKSSAHYAMSIVIRKEAREVSEYPDSLVLDFEDYIAECTTSNIFFSHQNEIVTPIADRFLDGITRQVVIEIAHKSGMKVTEKRLTLDDIESFESCFVTGTACEIQEVSLIDLGSKKVSFPGSSIITDLQKEFAIVAGK
jgi:branched-chain amino acid aminotransferase